MNEFLKILFCFTLIVISVSYYETNDAFGDKQTKEQIKIAFKDATKLFQNGDQIECQNGSRNKGRNGCANFFKPTYTTSFSTFISTSISISISSSPFEGILGHKYPYSKGWIRAQIFIVVI